MYKGIKRINDKITDNKIPKTNADDVGYPSIPIFGAILMNSYKSIIAIIISTRKKDREKELIIYDKP